MFSFAQRGLYSIGQVIRNPNYYHHLRDLKLTEKFPLEALYKLQFLRLKEAIGYAITQSLFYKELYADHSSYLLNEFNSLEDLRLIPIIDKEQLIARNKDIPTIKYFERTFLSETSGSTGQSLKFRKDENWDSFNRAARARGFSWYGVKPWDRNGYLWGYNFSPSAKLRTSILDSVQNRFRIFSYKEAEIIHFAKRLEKADYICGYSSMIYEVARRINEIPRLSRSPNLKMVCGTSEKIFDSYQNESLKAFGRKIVGEYGAAEAGVIAFECPHGNLHINMEGVLVEEENGEIIVTNLVARSFPIIRYKLGDYIKLKDPSFECPCGMKHRVIEDVLGRVGKLIRGKNNSYPSLTFYYVFKNLATNHNLELNYQAEQHTVGVVKLRIQQHLTPIQRSMLDKELLKYFGNDLTFEIFSGQTLHKMQGKYRDFISTVD